MAADSELRLYTNIPLDPRYEHTLYWRTVERQETFFNIAGGHLTNILTDFTYLRKESVVRVPYSLEAMEDGNINYCAMRNNNKWRYYFITNKVWKAQEVTELHVELDVMQTYQFDWDIPACFVEREHTTDDSIGANLLDEGLELGEMTTSGTTSTLTALNQLAVVVQSSVEIRSSGDNQVGPDINGRPLRGGMLGGVYSGFKLFCFPAWDTGVEALEAQIAALDEVGASDGIQSIWMYPFNLLDFKGDPVNLCYEISGVKQIVWQTPKISKIDGYTPRNKKLLTFPYCYKYVYNNMGESAKLHQELFSDNLCTMIVSGSLGNDGVVRLVPQNYRGYAQDNESGLSLSGFPTCAWNQDLYKIWMAQNANTQAVHMDQTGFNMATAAIGGIAGAIGAAATGNAAGAVNSIANGFTGVMSAHFAQAQLLAQRSDKDTLPPQSRGVQSSSCNITMGNQTFTLSDKTITRDFAERLDSYFDMYGYLTNKVKKPNLQTRPLWNYVKTSGCIVLGGIDANDRRKIGAIFDRGITLWHAPETMYRYDLAAGNVDV